jgi:hypothetical protein
MIMAAEDIRYRVSRVTDASSFAVRVKATDADGNQVHVLLMPQVGQNLITQIQVVSDTGFGAELLTMTREYQPHKITLALLAAWTEGGPDNMVESMVRHAVLTDYGINVDPETLDEWLAEWQESYRANKS